VPLIPHCQPAIWPTPIAPSRFAATIKTGSPDGCRVALIGLPDDLGVRMNHGRPGAAEGPRAFRAALAGYGVHDPMGLRYPAVFDAGDVQPAPGATEAALLETHERVFLAASALHNLGLFPVAVGGGHDLTFPFVRAAAERFGPSRFGGVYFDAHLDVRESVGSGMAFRRLMDDCGVRPLLICGINPLANSAQHAAYFKARGGKVSGAKFSLAPLKACSSIFCSFDLDVLDAAFAPGVSAMNPSGMSPREAQAALATLAADRRLRCLDFMELSPPHDAQGRTARLSAHLFLAFLAGFCPTKGGAP
jgi:formiminoglutamase